MTDPDKTDPCNDPYTPLPCNEHRSGPITEEEVRCAQQNWCDRLLDVSRKYHDPSLGNYREAAVGFINELYDFGVDEDGNGGKVFFRPTLAVFPYNFRTTFEGTLAYFIGEDPKYPDKGFALKKLLTAKYSNRVDEERTAIQRFGNIAVAMGNVCLTEGVMGSEGEVIEHIVVDKVFAYRKDPRRNKLKLIVHMSAARNEPGKKAIE